MAKTLTKAEKPKPVKMIPAGSEDARTVWHKYTVELKEVMNLGVAMPVATVLKEFSLGLYFARYTAPVPHIEYQVWSANKPSEIVGAIKKVLKHYKLTGKIKVTPCNGSALHAMAFKMACRMEKEGQNNLQMLNDVTHWLANMMGYTYAQEAHAALGKAHMCFSNCMGPARWEMPIFPNPDVLTRQLLEKERQAVRNAGRDARAKQPMSRLTEASPRKSRSIKRQ
jgi:hypothetical protein